MPPLSEYRTGRRSVLLRCATCRLSVIGSRDHRRCGSFTIAHDRGKPTTGNSIIRGLCCLCGRKRYFRSPPAAVCHRAYHRQLRDRSEDASSELVVAAHASRSPSGGGRATAASASAASQRRPFDRRGHIATEPLKETIGQRSGILDALVRSPVVADAEVHADGGVVPHGERSLEVLGRPAGTSAPACTYRRAATSARRRSDSCHGRFERRELLHHRAHRICPVGESRRWRLLRLASRRSQPAGSDPASFDCAIFRSDHETAEGQPEEETASR